MWQPTSVIAPIMMWGYQFMTTIILINLLIAVRCHIIG